MTLSRGLLDKLNAALVDRRIADGFQLLARADKELEVLQPGDPHAAAYLLCIAQWVDLGFRSIDYLNGIAARFVDVRRGQMSICDYLYLRMVEGHLAFLAEDAEGNIDIQLCTADRNHDPGAISRGGGPLLEVQSSPQARRIRARPAPYPGSEEAGPRNEGGKAGRGYQHSRKLASVSARRTTRGNAPAGLGRE